MGASTIVCVEVERPSGPLRKWEDTLSAHVGQVDPALREQEAVSCLAVDERSFMGRIEYGALGEMLLCKLAATNYQFTRSLTTPIPTLPIPMMLVSVSRGSCKFVQCGHTCILTEGDWTLIDTRQPLGYTITSPEIEAFATRVDQTTTTSGSVEAPPAWAGDDRLNVLVLGVDTRDSDPATRNTDTMLVISIDSLNKTAAMLSIPRDIYVDKPGTFQGKINGAFAFGGAQLARKLVDDLLGIPIHTYVLVNFDAFNKIIDGVGGVVVDAKRPVRDESFPTADFGVERIDILAGPQLMHGDIALTYARSRHDTNDYSRARRQQEVIGALRARLSQPEALRTLPALVDSVGTTIETDFDPANVLPLARTGTGIDSGAITSDVMYPCGGDYPHCELMVNLDFGFYLIPNRAKVRDFAARLFYDPKIRQEGARVEIVSTGGSAATATDVADRLALRAYGITTVSSASSAKSAIVLRNQSKRYTAEQLRLVLGNIPIETGDRGTDDITVRIGSDFKGFATDKG